MTNKKTNKSTKKVEHSVEKDLQDNKSDIENDVVKTTKSNSKKKDVENTTAQVVEKVSEKSDKKKSTKKQDGGEPTFFHYLVVLLILAAIFTGFYFVFNYFDKSSYGGAEVIDNPNLKIKLYKYPFVVNGQEYSIQFYNPVDELEKLDFPIEITKDDLLNTQDFKFIFGTSGSSNGQVVKVSGRLFPFLQNVYRFSLTSQEDIISSDNLTCEKSTLENKFIFFNSNSTQNKVSYNQTNGCIIFETTDPKYMGTLGDKFFLSIINS